MDNQPNNNQQPVGPSPEPVSAATPDNQVDTAVANPLQQTTASDAPKSPLAENERPHRLAALLLASSFGYFGVHQFYVGNKSQGILRLVLAILAFPLSIVAVGFLIAFVLTVWAVVDFVRIGLGNYKDSSGRELLGTDRDNSWAKILTIVALVFIALYLLFFVTFMLGSVVNYFNSFY